MNDWLSIIIIIMMMMMMCSGTVSDIASKALSHHTVPSSTVLPIEFLFNSASNVPQHRMAGQGVLSEGNGPLLHVLGHVDCLDNGGPTGRSDGGRDVGGQDSLGRSGIVLAVGNWLGGQ